MSTEAWEKEGLWKPKKMLEQKPTANWVMLSC